MDQEKQEILYSYSIMPSYPSNWNLDATICINISKLEIEINDPEQLEKLIQWKIKSSIRPTSYGK